MDSNTVQRLAKLRRRITKLEMGFPSGISVSAWDNGNSVRVTDSKWQVDYVPEGIKLTFYGYGYPAAGEALPDGVRGEDLKGKRYVLFTDGTGKEVNYLLPDNGLELKRVRETQFKALNPIQDYIIEECPTAKKAEEALADKYRDYVRAMWHMVEKPTDWTADSSHAKIDYRDSSTWHNCIVLHKFGCDDPRRGWINRSWTYIAKLQEIPTHKGLIRKINEHFENSHLGYKVSKKSPYTPPHFNEHWHQLRRLTEAGLLPA